MDDGKEMHDRLLEVLPAGSHLLDNCRYCLTEALDEPASGGAPVTTSFTQADLDRAASDAAKTANDRIAALEAQLAGAGVEAKVAEVTKAKDDEIAKLQKDLETSQLETAAAKKAADDLKAAHDEEKAQETAAKEKETRREARKTEIASLGIRLPWEGALFESKLDSWSEKSDAEWAAQIAEWKELVGTGAGAGAGAGRTLGGNRETDALRVGGSAATSKRPEAVMAALNLLGEQGIDPRTIH